LQTLAFDYHHDSSNSYWRQGSFSKLSEERLRFRLSTITFYGLKNLLINLVNWFTNRLMRWIERRTYGQDLYNSLRLILLKGGLFSWSPRRSSVPVTKEEMQSSEGVAFEFARVYHMHAGLNVTPGLRVLYGTINAYLPWQDGKKSLQRLCLLDSVSWHICYQVQGVSPLAMRTARLVLEI